MTEAEATTTSGNDPGGTASLSPSGAAAPSETPGERGPHEVQAAPQLASAQHGPHPNDAQYIRIAIILAVVTAAEVTLYYLKLQRTASNSLLLVFAAVKGTLVALYFMHLRFDSRVLRRLFLAGFILAVSVYLAYLTTLGVFLK